MDTYDFAEVDGIAVKDLKLTKAYLEKDSRLYSFLSEMIAHGEGGPKQKPPWILEQKVGKPDTDQKAWLSELTAENFLAIYDVVLDIRQEFQLSDKAQIPLLPAIVRYPPLMPADTINLRDRYCELRWKAAEFLRKKEIITELESVEGLHRWESRIRVAADIPLFNSFANVMDQEYQQRTARDEPRIDKPSKAKMKVKQPRNPWRSGSFYLFAAVVVIVLLASLSRLVTPWLLALVLIGGILIMTVIGAFQLRNDGILKDESFLKLMVETLKRLPLLKRTTNTGESEK